MKMIHYIRKKLSGIGLARQNERKQRRLLIVHDPDLVAMVRIADQRRCLRNDEMERILGRVRHILHHNLRAALPMPGLELSPQLMAKVAAIPEAEQRIRAIVDHTMSSRVETENNH